MALDPSSIKHIVGYGITGTTGVTGTTVASVQYNNSAASTEPLKKDNEQLKKTVGSLSNLCLGTVNVLGNAFTNGVKSPSSQSGLKEFVQELKNLDGSCKELHQDPTSVTAWSHLDHDISALAKKMGGKEKSEPEMLKGKAVSRQITGQA